MSDASAPPSFAKLTVTLRSAGCVFAEDEARLLLRMAVNPVDLAGMIQRRINGQPLEHIVGSAEFCGMQVIVEPRVFVPRRRTEFLVRQAIALTRAGSVVVDLCCGSGAVGAAVAASESKIELYATDIDPTAVHCARRNLERAGGHVCEGDLYTALPLSLKGRVDVLVANAPYVPTDAIRMMPPEARIFEQRLALDGGADGLDIQRRIAGEAPAWLSPRGHLLIETSRRQAKQTVGIFRDAGLTARLATSDEADATIVLGRRSGR